MMLGDMDLSLRCACSYCFCFYRFVTGKNILVNIGMKVNKEGTA